MTDLKPYYLVRSDEDDGSIVYEIFINDEDREKLYHVCTFIRFEGDKAKEEAELCLIALNTRHSPITPEEAKDATFDMAWCLRRLDGKSNYEDKDSALMWLFANEETIRKALEGCL